jgi:hypothetical protein
VGRTQGKRSTDGIQNVYHPNLSQIRHRVTKQMMQDITLIINSIEPIIMWPKGSYCTDIKSTVIRGNSVLQNMVSVCRQVETALGPHM